MSTTGRGKSFTQNWTGSLTQRTPTKKGGQTRHQTSDPKSETWATAEVVNSKSSSRNGRGCVSVFEDFPGNPAEQGKEKRENDGSN